MIAKSCILNNWDSERLGKMERGWGRRYPRYTVDMFKFAIDSGDSWIDLGCGFGRFLRFLLKRVDEPNYVGYDSSPAMVSRMHELYPDYHMRVFLRDITKYIPPAKEVIVSSAVFIHLKASDQQKILNNILKMDPLPKAIVLDINSYGPGKGEKGYFVEEVSKGNFRLSYQDHQQMHRIIRKKFGRYSVQLKRYKLRNNILKTAFFMKNLCTDL